MYGKYPVKQRYGMGLTRVCVCVCRFPTPASIRQELYCGWWGVSEGCHTHTQQTATTPATPAAATTASTATPAAGRKLLQAATQGPTAVTNSPSPSSISSSGAPISRAVPRTTISGPNTSQAVPTPVNTSNVNPTNLVQYPSLVIDWQDTAVGPSNATQTSISPAARLRVNLWLNNSNLQATVTPTIQRWTAAVNRVTNAYLNVTGQVQRVRGPVQLYLEGG